MIIIGHYQKLIIGLVPVYIIFWKLTLMRPFFKGGFTGWVCVSEHSLWQKKTLTQRKVPLTLRKAPLTHCLCLANKGQKGGQGLLGIKPALFPIEIKYFPCLPSLGSTCIKFYEAEVEQNLVQVLQGQLCVSQVRSPSKRIDKS